MGQLKKYILLTTSNQEMLGPLTISLFDIVDTTYLSRFLDMQVSLAPNHFSLTCLLSFASLFFTYPSLNALLFGPIFRLVTLPFCCNQGSQPGINIDISKNQSGPMHPFSCVYQCYEVSVTLKIFHFSSIAYVTQFK